MPLQIRQHELFTVPVDRGCLIGDVPQQRSVLILNSPGMSFGADYRTAPINEESDSTPADIVARCNCLSWGQPHALEVLAHAPKLRSGRIGSPQLKSLVEFATAISTGAE